MRGLRQIQRGGAPLPFMAIDYYRFRYKLLIITVFTINFVNISLSYCKLEKRNHYFLNIFPLIILKICSAKEDPRGP